MNNISTFLVDWAGIIRLLPEAIAEWFTVNYENYYYQNISFTDNSLSFIRLTIIAFFVALGLSSFLVLLNRKVYGQFVDSLVNEGCTSPDKGKTLAELGYLKNSTVRGAIKKGSVYKSVLSCPAKDKYDEDIALKRAEYEEKAKNSAEKMPRFSYEPYKYDLENDKLYIPEEKIGAAEMKFTDKKGSVGIAVLIALASLIALIFALKFLPELLQFADNFVGILSKNK